MAETMNCPLCGSAMSFRLKIYECEQCGHTVERQPAEADGGRRRTTGGRQEAWQAGKRANPRYAAPPPEARADGPSLYGGGFSTPLDHLHDEDDSRPAPSREKMMLLAFFLGKGVVNIVIALAMIGGRDWGVVGSALANQLIGIGLLALVLYVPINFIKYIVGFCSCAYALFTLVGLLLSAVLVPLLGLLAPMASGAGMQILGVLAWVLALADVFGYIWLASRLFRDLQGVE